MKFKKLPKTTASTYISGLHSLNLDFKAGTGFDWHFANYWMEGKAPIKLYGEGQKTNTNEIYGFMGVADRQVLLMELEIIAISKPVYIADHIRAMCDLVFESLNRHSRIGYAKGGTKDFFYNNLDLDVLFVELLKLVEFLGEEEKEILYGWLSKEFRTQYRSWKSGTLQKGKNLPHVVDTDGFKKVYSWF